MGNLGSGTSAGTASSGTYHLSGGTLTGAASASRGIILGTNNGTTGTFQLSGSGKLVMDSSIVMVGRSDFAVTGSTGHFNQSGGTADIGTLTIAGGSGSGNAGHLNLSGGVFTAATLPSLATAANSSASITLGGSAIVTLPALPTVRGAGSTATVYFDGGTLIPAAASATYLGGLTNAFVRSGGAEFEVPSGKNITVTQSLLADPASPGGGLAKSGSGKLTLSGTSTYTGNTTVSEGTLELLLGGSLKFVPTSNGVTNKISGSGTLLLKGAFAIDLAAAAAASGNAWTLVAVGTLTETYDASFAVTGFTQSSNVWTKTVGGGGTWTFTEASGVLSYTAPAGFTSWISGYPVGASNQPGDDFDKDGINHLLEYALNGSPTIPDPSILPDLLLTATAFEFTYSRRDLSRADTTQRFRYGSNLAAWTAIPIPAGPGVSTSGIATITITDTGSSDSVKISIPRSAAPGGKLFGHLEVVP